MRVLGSGEPSRAMSCSTSAAPPRPGSKAASTTAATRVTRCTSIPSVRIRIILTSIPGRVLRWKGIDGAAVKIDLHTHILPPQWPDLRERYGYGGFVRLERHAAGCGRMTVDGKLFREVGDNC